MTTRLAAAALALLCGPLAAWLAAHHPLSGPLALAACAAIAVMAWLAPARWLLLLLPLLPAIGFAPWTGWIVVEELDLVVLSIATGAYLRLALQPAPGGRVAVGSTGFMAWVLLGLLAVSTGVSMLRGFADAGGLQWGWWQGYREPLNFMRNHDRLQLMDVRSAEFTKYAANHARAILLLRVAARRRRRRLTCVCDPCIMTLSI